MLTRSQIQNKVQNKSWITPFDKIIAVCDEKNKLIQIYEDHARGKCYGAAAWSAYHYKKTSSLVIDAWRDGPRDIFMLKIGIGKLNLVPSHSSGGIEQTRLIGDECHITYAGLAGAGVGVTLCRGLAEGVKGVEILEEGGGNKLGKAVLILPKMVKVHIGIDDTDCSDAGATWSLANELGVKAEKKPGIVYINHTLVQLFPMAPNKTKNCVATVLTFAVKPEKKDNLVKFISKSIMKETLSADTGIAVFEGIKIPEQLVKFADEVRTKLVKIEDTKKMAAKTGVDLIKITGEAGLVGAAGALGYAEKHEAAVQPAVSYQK
jgi:methanogenesis imperfect marker protein 11